MPYSKTPERTRFWNKVERTENCWLWTAARDKDGYGLFKDGTGRMRRAHRYLFAMNGDPVPPKMHIDHLCRNPSCVRPDHLEVVTPRDNVLRGKCTNHTDKCKYGHWYTPENTVIRRGNGRRRCRTCLRIADRRSYRREKGLPLPPYC